MNHRFHQNHLLRLSALRSLRDPRGTIEKKSFDFSGRLLFLGFSVASRKQECFFSRKALGRAKLSCSFTHLKILVYSSGVQPGGSRTSKSFGKVFFLRGDYIEDVSFQEVV